jgi:hypothetical protein
MNSSGCPSNTVSPTGAPMARTMPPVVASITCSIFIASITSTG